MSVEESRRDVRDDVAQHIEDELWASGTWLEQRLDRLILEVRAEMPCYFENETHPFTPWMSPDRKRICFSGGVMNPWVIDNPCPACWARRQLQKVAEAV